MLEYLRMLGMACDQVVALLSGLGRPLGQVELRGLGRVGVRGGGRGLGPVLFLGGQALPPVIFLLLHLLIIKTSFILRVCRPILCFSQSSLIFNLFKDVLYTYI